MNLKFRDRQTAKDISRRISEVAPERDVKIIHVCGTHEAAVVRHGIRDLLPDTVELVMGPGCPVCVTPVEDVDLAIALAESGVTVATYGDMLRVPGTEKSLKEAEGDVRSVSGPGEAGDLPGGSVFFGPGFETTAVTHAAALRDWPEGVYFLSAGRRIPPAMELLQGIGDLEFDGLLAPGHVSTVIGLEPYRAFEESYSVPVAVGGFEPLDVLAAVLVLVEQAAGGESRVENVYPRAVSEQGNPAAMELVDVVFDTVGGRWRGIGRLPDSALELSPGYEELDARLNFEVETPKAREIRGGCKCHLILTAKAGPDSCDLFGDACTPRDPHGPCMVSREGMCRVWLERGRST